MEQNTKYNSITMMSDTSIILSRQMSDCTVVLVIPENTYLAYEYNKNPVW